MEEKRRVGKLWWKVAVKVEGAIKGLAHLLFTGSV